MSLTRTTSRSLAPLLSRLVLAAAFVPLGWEKVMGEERIYQGQDAGVLRSLGIGGADDAKAAAIEFEGVGVLARPQDKATGTQPTRPDPPHTGTLGSRTSPAPKSTQPDKPKPEAEPDPDVEDSDPPVTTTAPSPPPPPRPAPPARGPASDDQSVRAKAMYQDAVLMVNAGWGPPDMPQWLPVWGARAIAFIQLVGSGLLLVGIFARVWAAGLAIVVAVGFFLTSSATVSMYALTAPMPTADFNSLFVSLGLFVFALCLALTGAGSVSLDGMLFQGGSFDGDEHLI